MNRKVLSSTPEYRFEFRYNDKGQIIEKKSMKWNGTDWINYYCMEVTYTDTEAHIDYSLWNKNKKRLSLRRNMYIR